MKRPTMSPRFLSSGSDQFAGYRPRTDADRYRAHGPIHPMPVEPIDWFHVAIRALMICGTAFVIYFAFHAAPPASPLPDAQSPALGVGAGGKVLP